MKLLSVLILFLITGCMGREQTRTVYVPRGHAADPAERSTVGNGSDNPKLHDGSAWFLGNRQIRFCAVVGEGFGLDTLQANAAIENAFKEWREYLSGPRRPFDFNHAQLFLNSSALPTCDGTQDLTFYMEGSKPLLPRKPVNLDNPIAYAQRETYNPKMAWSKGFIWLARPFAVNSHFPDWKSSPISLHITLMHELGHVLGCGHVPNTLMDVDLSPKLAKMDASLVDSPRRLAIHLGPDDIGKRELMPCRECGIPKTPATCHMPRTVKGDAPITALNLVSELWGQFANHGKMACAITAEQKSTTLAVQILSDELNSEDDSYDAQFTSIKFVVGVPQGEPIFKRVYEEMGKPVMRQQWSETFFYTGKGSNFLEKAMDVTIVRNALDSNLMIYPVGFNAEDGLSVVYDPKK